VLGLTGLAPFAFLLVASVIGIAALPLVFFAALAMIFAGKAGVCVLIGRWSGGLLKTAAFEKTAAAAAAGAALLFLCCAVPIAGLGVWALTTVLGFGAALLAGVDSLQRERGALAESAPAAEAPADATAAQPPAGFWLRLGATVIDGLAFLLIGGLTHLLVLGLGGWALYQVGMWAWKGTTLGGMRIFEAWDPDGEAPPPGLERVPYYAPAVRLARALGARPAEHAEGERVVLREGALGLEGGRDGHAQALGQAAQRVPGAR